jgi:hypothetical protein
LRPTGSDYFVLKPRHSGFYGTTLDTLLDALRIRRVILTGIAGHLRPVHRERRLHARAPNLRAGRLHRLEHRGRQRSCAAPNRNRSEGQYLPVSAIAVSQKSLTTSGSSAPR